MDQADIPALLSRLASDEDAARKMAVFKLQSSINDPAFADVFISSGGLTILRRLILSAGGNTLAYALQSLSRLLEVDMGWDVFEGPTAGDLVERIVELIVTNPLVNILRGAMSILVALVSHNQASSAPAPPDLDGSAAAVLRGLGPPANFGLRALKPAVAVYPQFFELVIQQLQSADHALCANALMLVNALIRDAVAGEGASAAAAVAVPGATAAAVPAGEEWAKLIKRLQDLGLIKAVYNLMQSSALQDLAHPLLEFQSLTKVLLRKWREVRVDLERPEHRRALKGLHLASAPDRTPAAAVMAAAAVANGTVEKSSDWSPAAASARKGSRRHNPEKWRRLGFDTESPSGEFEEAGFLGMMDLTDYVRKNEDGFQKLLLEQSSLPLSQRCPVARASLAVTLTLYEHFDVDRADLNDLSRELQGYYQSLDAGGSGADRIFRPLLLQWSRLHTAGLQAFFRVWKATGAAGRDDFEKVAELVRILVEQVVGQAGRTKDVAEVEEELLEQDCAQLRELQMGLLDLSFEDQWGKHLVQVRDELRAEALQFVKEQRVRCLLQGAWFSRPLPRRDREAEVAAAAAAGKRRLYEPKGWRYVRLSHNRRYLHYADFVAQTVTAPGLDALTEKVDLSTISSVVSNVSAAAITAEGTSEAGAPATTTKITVYAYAPSDSAPKEGEQPDTTTTGTTASVSTGAAAPGGSTREVAILTLHLLNYSIASEWLDGLLMLLHQAPITAETNKLVGLVSDYGLKIRLLNVRLEAVYAGPPPGAGVVPSREGLDDDYYYEI